MKIERIVCPRCAHEFNAAVPFGKRIVKISFSNSGNQLVRCPKNGCNVWLYFEKDPNEGAHQQNQDVSVEV